MFPGLANQFQVESQVVDRGNLECQELFTLKEVVKVSASVALVDSGGTFRIDGAEIVGPFGVAEIDNALPGEDLAVAPVAGRHDAVEHVDTAFDAFEDVHRRSHAHEVARAVLGKNLVDHLDHFVHFLCRFAHGQSADGVTFGIFLGHKARALAPQIGINTTLHDGKQRLVVAVLVLCFGKAANASIQPAVGEV